MASFRLTHTQAVWLMVLATLMWSMAGVVSRQLESAARFEVTFWRSAFTALSLLVILPLWRWRERGSMPRELGAEGLFERHWGILVRSRSFWISGVCWSIMFTAFMLALSFTSVANVLIMLSLGPLFTALLAHGVMRHRLPMRTWLAVVLAGVGIAYMYGFQLWVALTDDTVDSSRLLLGTLTALCVPVAGAVNWTVVQRSQSQGQSIDLVPAVMMGAVLSAGFTLPLALPWSASASDVTWLAFLGLAQLAIPCSLAVMCARVLKAPEMSLLSLLEIIFGILLAWVLVNEVPSSAVLLGGGVVMLALVLNEWLAWRDRRSSAMS
jgi:drug/metabolite transporter (DMT)-like permease